MTITDFIPGMGPIIRVLGDAFRYVKSRSKRKRSYIEPRFGEEWKESASHKLGYHLDCVKIWISDLSAGRIQRDSYPHLNKNAVKYQFGKTESEYDPRFVSTLKSYFTEVDEVSGYVDSYNHLRDATTGNFYFARDLYVDLKDDDVKKSVLKRIEDAKRITSRYGVEIKDLASNETYKQDLAQIESQIHGAVKRLEVKYEEILTLVKFYNAKFPKP